MTDRPEVILNVNDDAAARYVVTRLLGRSGFDVVEVATGEEALGYMRSAETPPALVVLDVQLPDISGLEVCRRLKMDPATAGVPVLQTSATFTTAERRAAGLESGADGYLVQPIDPVELVATVRALLRTREAERSVRAAAREWQRTFDAISEPAALFGADGRLLRCNHALASAAGLSTGTPGPQAPSYGELLARLAPGAAGPRFAEARARRSRQTVEASVDGRCLRLTLDPIEDETGEVDRLVLVCTDLTDIKRLEALHRQRAEELAEADRRKDEFLAMLAHELRNPLNAIAAATSLQERVGPNDEKSAKLRALVARQTRHLARLVEDLLEASRLTRGRIELKRERIDLATLMRDAARAGQAFVDARKHVLTLNLPEGPLWAEVDPLRLEQVVANLLHNAAKFTDPGGAIAVSLAPEERGGRRWAVLRVRDNGVGIPAEQLATIFDLFVQGEQGLARTTGGLGIGLTVARKLVELHGGTIEAHSEGARAGAEFVLSLPLPLALTDSPIAARAGDGPRGARCDVLVVEDDGDTAELLRDLLEHLGHRVRVALDGVSGVAAALGERPDVAIVDIGLPGLDGYEVARNLRTAPQLGGLVLVALTGYGRPEDRARALDAGFDLHLVKPLDPDQLARVLENVAARRPANAHDPHVQAS